MALVTLAEYKTYAGISGTDDDAVLQVLISAAQDAIERFCGRDAGGFESGTKTEYYDGRGSEYLFLRSWPASSITSVKWRDAAGNLTTISATSYRLKSDRTLVRTGVNRGRFTSDEWGYVGEEALTYPQFSVQPQFSEGLGNIEVVYAGGFATIPGSLKLAVYRLVDGMFASRRENPDMQSETIGSYSYTKGKGGYDNVTAGGVSLPPEVASYLAPFGSVLP